MKANNHFFLALFFLICLQQSLFAQRLNTASVGIVDFSGVVMLHPKFIDYIPSKGVFKITRVKEKTTYVKEQKEAINAEIQQLEYDKAHVEQQLLATRNQYEEQIYSLEQELGISPNSDVATGTRLNREHQLEQRSQRIREQTAAKKANLYAQLGTIESRLQAIKKSPDIAQYTTIEETRKIISEIISEVRGIIQAVADRNGLSLVLNSSYERGLKSKAFKIDVKDIPDYTLKDILYAPYVPPYDNRQNQAVTMYYDDIYSKTRQWINNENNILGSNYELLPTTGVVIGGKDITKEVLFSLFKKYKINENISKAVVNAIYY